MSRINSPGGAGRRVKAGTKEYKGNLKKIEDRRDTGMTIAMHKGFIERSEKAIKKHTAILKKMEVKTGVAVGQMKTNSRNASVGSVAARKKKAKKK